MTDITAKLAEALEDIANEFAPGDKRKTYGDPTAVLEAQVQAVLDVAGSVLRRHRLFFAGERPIVRVVHDGLLYQLAVSAPLELTVAMTDEVLHEMVDKELDVAGLAFSFIPTGQMAAQGLGMVRGPSLAAAPAAAQGDVRALIYRVESTMNLEQAPAEDFNAGCYVVPVASVRMAMEPPLQAKAEMAKAEQAAPVIGVDRMVESVNGVSWWVAIRFGDRCAHLGKYPDAYKNRAEWQAARLRHLFGQAEKPSILDYPDPPVSASATPTTERRPLTECKWTSDDDGTYWTTCGQGFVFNCEGGPKEHDMRFCCYCGSGITAGTTEQAKEQD